MLEKGLKEQGIFKVWNRRRYLRSLPGQAVAAASYEDAFVSRKADR